LFSGVGNKKVMALSTLASLLLGASLLSVVGADAAPSKEERIRGTFFGALVADALTLGSHYEYDAKVIKQAYAGTISRYMAPGEAMGGSTHGVGWGRRNYHPGQKAGDQTDYGEHNVVVLEHLAERKNKKAPIALKELIPQWRKRLESSSWGAWRCTQTKQTLQQIAQNLPYENLGGMSNAMAVRHFAAHAVFNKEEDVAQAARTVMFTHRDSEALGGGEFFARAVHKIIYESMKPREAFEAAAKALGAWYQDKVKQGIKKFEEAADPNTPLSKEEFVDDLAATSMARLWDVGKTEPIKVGKASPTEGTLPTSVYLVLRYENDFVAGVKANAMIGGDSASRAVAVGAVLGAYHGVSAIPEDLRSTLNAWKKCDKMLNSLPLLTDRSDL
jgi:ADP-ribosylglycohydrolase